MKSKIPFLLIYARLVMGFVVLLMALTHVPGFSTWAVVLLSAGLLSDIFDGIIARRLGTSTQLLRRLDSTVDQVFFVSVVAAAFVHCPDFFTRNGLQLIVLASFEAATYAVSFIKFRKEIATHSIGAKIWTLTLFGTLIQLLVQCDSGVLWPVCFWTGIATRLEIIAIVLVLKTWTNDVPTLVHAVRLSNGRMIKRNKLFNG